MSGLPLYEVEFVASERRLDDRRKALCKAALPTGLKQNRRVIYGRRIDDTKMVYLRVI